MNNWIKSDFDIDKDGMPTLKLWKFSGQVGREWRTTKEKIAYLREYHNRPNLRMNFIPQLSSWSIWDGNFIFDDFNNLEEAIKSINFAYSLAKYKREPPKKIDPIKDYVLSKDVKEDDIE